MRALGKMIPGGRKREIAGCDCVVACLVLISDYCSGVGKGSVLRPTCSFFDAHYRPQSYTGFSVDIFLLIKVSFCFHNIQLHAVRGVIESRDIQRPDIRKFRQHVKVC